ncbi:flavin reductase family protein [Serratia sp. M24T3]|uniref:flavin reductase family protein n=1 Tax=Serratia sp. M24T3 TaxID=932213 RepID=UPI00025BBAA2|nr:flavin reductase [Serratia sp. M24T3]EIC83125.1 flavoprotein oxidoreductase [Serratia sp. M24T3]
MTDSRSATGSKIPSVADATSHVADAYRGGMRLLPAGVCLITTRHNNEHNGMIATAVTSVSAEPPTLLVCVNRHASMFGMIQETGNFCVNVLSKEAVSLVNVFSNSSRRAERFQTGDWTVSDQGYPICAEALVSFECRLAKIVDWHTHGIFLGEVTRVIHPRADAAPLLYMDRRFHHLNELVVTEV